MNRLEGRVALVTGGSRGIGRAIVDRFVAEGASVMIADLEPPEGKQAEVGPTDRVAYVQLDVGDEAQWPAAVTAIRTRFGRLDILVANAGIGGAGRVQDMTLAQWHRTMRVNVDGVFLATRSCADLLAESGKSWRGGASIINMSSIMGLVGLPHVSDYNASKGAVRMFSKSTALGFAADNTPIRVNSIHPGFVETPQLMSRANDASLAFYTAATPLARLAQPSEIAAAVAFLASDDASYMTGSELIVDGGYTAR